MNSLLSCGIDASSLWIDESDSLESPKKEEIEIDYMNKKKELATCEESDP